MDEGMPPQPTTAALPSAGVLEADRGFVVATGIECSAPLVAGGVRQDELVLTKHVDRFAEDFAITADLGIRTIRYGIPFHLVAADPADLDWRWTDAALGSLRDAGLTPVADLLHFGLPARLWGFGDAGVVEVYTRFVEAFVARYPWIRHYTPVNEPWISATFSAREGMWNERRRDERSHVAALDHLLQCDVVGMEIVRAARPDAVFLQSDACERWVPGSDQDAVVEEAALRNDLRFAPFELAYGRSAGAYATDWLLRNGLPESRLVWLAEHGSDAGCIVGHDYYHGNHREIFAPGRSRSIAPDPGYGPLAREFHDRLQLPFFLAETNRTAEEAVDWLTDVWNDAVELADDGLPIRGVCWYSLTDQVDWDTCLAEVNGRVNSLGLVDLDRQARPVFGLYRELATAALEGRVERIGGSMEEAA
jgi:beta-glucosidase